MQILRPTPNLLNQNQVRLNHLCVCKASRFTICMLISALEVAMEQVLPDEVTPCC